MRHTHNADRSKCQRQRGFTLIELLVVVAIGIIVTAMAVPVMTTTLDDYKLRAAMVSASNLTQRCRTVAIQQNLSQRLHFATVNKLTVLFVEPAANVAVQPATTDQQFWLPSQFSIPGAPNGPGAPPLLTGLSMWGSAAVTPKVNQDAYFNSRGLPCLPNPVVCNATNGFVYYYKYQGRSGTKWVATSISPAGRIENWFWNGTSWGN